MSRSDLRELSAEFLGTFILIVFGIGVVAQVVFSNQQNGTFFSINIAWGLAVTMGVYVAGGVSGAHLNPAVTLAMAVLRGFSWRKVLPYCLAQLAGAFVASVVVYATYHEALDQFDGGTRQVVGEQATAGIWATYPQPYLSNVPGPNRWHRAASTLHLRLDGRTEFGTAGDVSTGRYRSRCLSDRDDLRLQRRLRDQPCARSRATIIYRICRLGE